MSVAAFVLGIFSIYLWLYFCTKDSALFYSAKTSKIFYISFSWTSKIAGFPLFFFISNKNVAIVQQ